MTTTIDLNEERLQAFLDRAFADLAASYGGVMVSLGDRLGLYRALAGAGPLTSAELAERTGCAERYVREWLGSQVAAAYVDYDPEAETYELPPEHAAVLADPDSPMLLTPAYNVPASMWMDEEQAAEGVPHRRGGALGALTTSGSSAGWRPSSRTPTAVRSCRSGCPPSTGSSSASSRARRLPTSAAATATPRC